LSSKRIDKRLDVQDKLPAPFAKGNFDRNFDKMISSGLFRRESANPNPPNA
jgi:hypothetical protein